MSLSVETIPNRTSPLAILLRKSWHEENASDAALWPTAILGMARCSL